MYTKIPSIQYKQHLLCMQMRTDKIVRNISEILNGDVLHYEHLMFHYFVSYLFVFA